MKYSKKICMLLALGMTALGSSVVTAASPENTQELSGDIHYVSIKSNATDDDSNYNNNGAKAKDSMVIGIESSSEGINSTVIGKNNHVTGNKNSENNSAVVGTNLTVAGVHNAVFGTDYYNYDNKKTLVAGDQNTVLGVGNLVGYTGERNGTKWTYIKVSDHGSDQNVAVGMKNTVNGGSIALGTSNEVENIGEAFGHGNKIIGSNNGGGQYGIAMGRNNTSQGEYAITVGGENKTKGDWSAALGYKNNVTGTYSVGIGKGNTVTKNWGVAIGEGNTANGTSSVAIGSASETTGDFSIAMGDTSKAEGKNSIAIGHNAQANVAGGVALGVNSVASVDAGVAGYDPGTKASSIDTSSTWKATDAAVSVGDGTEHTRQITGVAAGTNDTDVVNVAQLKKAMEGVAAEAKDGNDTLKSSDSGLTLNGNTLSMNVEDTAGNKVTGSVDLSGILGSVKDTRNTVKAGTNVTVDEAANDDGSTTYTVNVEGNGKVEEGNTGLVSGNTVYEETRVKEDGNYIKKDYTAAENITALDKQVGENANNITNLNNSITNLSGRVSDLDNRMNKVGAGAAALAALHPLDFEAEDKFNLAVGYGNYKDANAMAVGAFYRPDEKTMFSVGGSMGNGEKMINVGVSLKFGKHGEYSGYSRTQLVDVINGQNKTIADLQNQVDEIMKQLAELKK